ncbi:biotin/lipoyl-binding protein [Paraburkholderia sp. A3BS-1L]|uniref:HlyD family secretion protein n=1 Tax=Paraburkholderia sp. A3BS-1L TaxID=3028375 RepID=UPI003DA8486A
MKHRLVFAASLIGFLAAVAAAWVFGIQQPPQPPVFQPAANPYAHGVYATGIVESDQSAGANVNLYPEVSGTVTRLLVHDGDRVKAGDVLLTIDDSVQRANAGQLAAQALAAQALLDELEAQPRPETRDVADAQVRAARASLKMAQDTYAKQKQAWDIDPKAVSRDVLDSAENAMHVARANLEVVTRQDRLTRAGAWVYEVRNQQGQVEALRKAAASAEALLAHYTLRAPSDGIVLAVNTAQGSYLSQQGVYDTYTRGMAPVIVLGSAPERLAVRCYVDEILISRLPQPDHLKGRMTVRGANIAANLTFERIQPYVTPKIELSDQRTERVDLRVLPVIFRIEPQAGLRLYPGQIVDVYIAAR